MNYLLLALIAVGSIFIYNHLRFLCEAKRPIRKDEEESYQKTLEIVKEIYKKQNSERK